MSFRPQFANSTPPGWRDDDFVYSFDSSNTPSLSGTIPALGYVMDVPLLLQPDTEFHWQAVKVSATSAGSSLALRWKGPYGDYLSDDYVPLNAYDVPSGRGNYIGTQPVVLESKIVCPPGGVIWLYLYNPTAGTYTIDIAVTLLGVKRRKDLRCA